LGSGLQVQVYEVDNPRIPAPRPGLFFGKTTRHDVSYDVAFADNPSMTGISPGVGAVTLKEDRADWNPGEPNPQKPPDPNPNSKEDSADWNPGEQDGDQPDLIGLMDSVLFDLSDEVSY
jgi:hypothetical protein